MQSLKPHFTVSLDAVDRSARDIGVDDFSPFMGNRRILSDKRNPAINPAIFGQVYKDDLSLISSAHGKLERLMVTIPNYVFESSDYKNAYSKLFKTLPDYTILEIVVNENKKLDIETWIKAQAPNRNYNLYVFPIDMKFSVWAEDAYVMGVDKNGSGEPYFIEPYNFKRSADSVIADFVSHASDYSNTSAPLYFQGGNILIGDDFFMIGRDYPINTVQDDLIHIPRGTPEDEIFVKLKTAYQRYLDPNRDVFFPGSAQEVPGSKIQIDVQGDSGMVEIINRGTGYNQPIFHIDMCASLVGRNSEGEYEVLVGDTRLAETITGENWGDRSLAHHFDSFAESLISYGFKVIRNPLPLAYWDRLKSDGSEYSLTEFKILLSSMFDETRASNIINRLEARGARRAFVRSWYFATSNNLIAEITDSGKTVWIPEYGFGNYSHLKKTDDANRKIWTDKGFTVHGLGDFHAFAYNLGAAHCITKYMGRGQNTGLTS